MEDAFVSFVEAGASQRARRLGRANEQDDATFNFTVSHADGDQVPVQISEAEAFLSAHEAELAELRRRDGVRSALLDFGWSIPSDRAGQFNRFPSSLLTLCSKLGLDLEISVYLNHAGGSEV